MKSAKLLKTSTHIFTFTFTSIRRCRQQVHPINLQLNLRLVDHRQTNLKVASSART